MARGLRILGIESPGPAGHPGRTAALLMIAASLGHRATLFVGAAGLRRLQATLPRRRQVQVIAGTHLEAVSRDGFDVVILTGEPVATRYLQQVRALMPGAAVIFDADGLGFVCAGRHNQVEGDGLARLRALDIKRREVTLARGCDMTWISSRADERWLTMAAPGLRLEVVPPVCDVTREGPGFHERSGVVLVSDPREPSRRDAESFFRRQILPHVRTRCPELSYEGLSVDPISGESSEEGAPGTEFGRRLALARVLVAPFRFSSGVPFEVVHAMAQGVPVVATTAGAEGLDPGALDTVLVADTARGLADHVAAVLTEPLLWERLAKGGQALVADRFSSGAARARLERILGHLLPDPMDRADPPPGPDLALPSPAGPGATSAPESAVGGPPPGEHPEPVRIASVIEEKSSVSVEGPRVSLPPASLPASVIVCTHNGSRVIEETLESLVRQDFPPEAFEILIVDNASTDATPEVVQQIASRHPGRIRLVSEPVLGHSRARNRGIRESRGDVIAFTDDDARVSPRWLRALIDTCERPRVGCAGGPVRAVLEGPLPEWVTPLFLPYLALFDKGREEVELTYNEYPRGVNMAYPRQSFREVGLFSTAFGLKGRSLLYYDEIELCYRLERLGRRILYTPAAEVNHAIHAERLSVGWFKQRFYSQGKTEAYFDLVHRERRFVVQRLREHGQLARAERARPREPGSPVDLHRLWRTWACLGYGVGAVQGSMTGIRRRARPPSYNGTAAASQPGRRGAAVTSIVAAGALQASIVIPSKNGGALFGLALERLFAQRTPWPFEVIVVDSGSSPDSLEIVRRFPVRLHTIPPSEFNHGRTRDLGASLARGEHLVFLNQDAVPCSDDWLVTLLQPLQAGDEYAAVQGGIQEFPDRPRFFWDSCGPRFYFTRESERWIPRHDGIGFSTVNAAIRRAAWEACPFGEAVIMEDKKWQRETWARGGRIAYQPEAAVYHTHNYNLRQVIKRCQQEGFGWKLVGETYSFGDMLSDTLSMDKYRELWRGLRAGQVRTGAELLFPFLRAWLVFRGNRLVRKYPG